MTGDDRPVPEKAEGVGNLTVGASRLVGAMKPVSGIMRSRGSLGIFARSFGHGHRLHDMTLSHKRDQRREVRFQAHCDLFGVFMIQVGNVESRFFKRQQKREARARYVRNRFQAIPVKPLRGTMRSDPTNDAASPIVQEAVLAPLRG